MKLIKLLIAATCACAVNSALAHPPQPNVYDNGNVWTITGYFDATPTHIEAATQLICFSPYARVGTQIQGSWYSLNFPDWNGNYAQEGDQLFMHGDFGSNYGHDGMTFDITTDSLPNEAFGHWKEWIENATFGTTIAFGNAKLVRVENKKCDAKTGQELKYLNIPPRMLLNGGEAKHPAQEGQVPLDASSLK